MPVDGTWKISIETPMGTRSSTLALRSDGDKLVGTQSEGKRSTDIADGKVAGNKVSWKISIDDPLPMELAFSGEVAGDKISGKASAGLFGSFPFSGARA